MQASRIAKAASAAFFFGLMVCSDATRACQEIRLLRHGPHPKRGQCALSRFGHTTVGKSAASDCADTQPRYHRGRFIPSWRNSMIRLMLGLVAAAMVASSAMAQPAVERGGYLVNTIMTCANCHSPKGPPPAVAGKDYSGGLRFDEPPFDVTAPNITSDKDT